MTTSSRARAAALATSLVTASCTGLLGLEPLAFDDGAGPGGEGGPGREGGGDDGTSPGDDTGPDGSKKDGSGVDGNPGNTRIKNITFEDGILTGAKGADMAVGVVIANGGAIDGAFAASTNNSIAWVTQGFGGPRSEIFITFCARRSTASQPGNSTLFRIEMGPSNRFILEVDVAGAVTAQAITTGTQTAGLTTPLPPDGTTVACFGVHASTAGTLRTFDVFGGPRTGFTDQKQVSLTATADPSQVDVGAVKGQADVVFDDIRIDTASMPAIP